MGAEPWLVRKPFIMNPARVLQRFYDEILKETHDWPEIRLGDNAWEDLPRGAGHYLLLHKDGNPVLNAG